MIYLGADHRGYELKEKIKGWLGDWGYKYEDMGAFEYDKDDDNPIFAHAVAHKILEKEDNKGILICGSGIEIAIAANKIKGIRAGTVMNPEQAAAAVNDEDLNILALPADYLSGQKAREIIRSFLETKFAGKERYIRRINEIKELENE